MPDITNTENPGAVPGQASEQGSVKVAEAPNTEISGSEPGSETQAGKPSEDQTTDETKAAEPGEPQGAAYQKLRQRAQEAEDRLKRAEEQMARSTFELEQIRRQQPASTVAKKPDISDFPDLDAYEKASQDWFKQQAKIEASLEVRRENTERQYRERVTEAMKKYPDYSQAISNLSFPITEGFSEAIEVIKNTDNGTDIAYYLGKNVSEAYRIASMPRKMAAYEIGRLAEKIGKTVQSPRIKTHTDAPNPPSTLATGDVESGKDISRMTTEEYALYMNQLERKEKFGT